VSHVKIIRSVTLLFALGGMVLVVGRALPACLPVLQDGWFQTRYDYRPASIAFEHTFHRPVPTGVRDLRATGHSWPGGVLIWVTFRAGPGTRKALLASYSRVRVPPGEDPTEYVRNQEQYRVRYDAPDRVGWRSLYQVKKLDRLERASSSAHGSSTTVWVDRATDRVYAFYWAP
jgi:hypothetical protein